MDKFKNAEDATWTGAGRKNSKERQTKEDRNRRASSELPSELENRDVYFIIPRTVYVFYGPYMYQGIMDYRTERLQGLKTFLEKLGVTIVLKPYLDHVNLVRVWFLEEQIFSCKITNLMYGGDGELDPLCWEAAASLEKFIRKVLRGLRRSRPEATPESLKRPFCPCFHQDLGEGSSVVRSEDNEMQSDLSDLNLMQAESFTD